MAQVGDRVRAIRFSEVNAVINDNETVPPGTQGTIQFIDDAGTLHVKWDNGSTIGLLPRWDHWESLRSA